MFPRNLTLYRLPHSFDLSGLEQGLDACKLNPVGALELESQGFVSPFGYGYDALHHQIGYTSMLTLGIEKKLIPSAIINDLLQKKIKEVEKAEGRTISGRARRRVREDLVHELLPRALVKASRVNAFLFRDIGVLAVDTSSRKTADAVVSRIRHALGSFPALPINAEIAPRSVLTEWLASGELPEGAFDGDKCIGGALYLNDSATLQDPAGSGVVKIDRLELGSHLDTGMVCTRLGLTLGDHLSFTIGEDLVIRKFKILDGALYQLESTERDDLRAELDARFALFDGEFRYLFNIIERIFKLSKAS